MREPFQHDPRVLWGALSLLLSLCLSALTLRARTVRSDKARIRQILSISTAVLLVAWMLSMAIWLQCLWRSAITTTISK